MFKGYKTIDEEILFLINVKGFFYCKYIGRPISTLNSDWSLSILCRFKQFLYNQLCWNHSITKKCKPVKKVHLKSNQIAQNVRTKTLNMWLKVADFSVRFIMTWYNISLLVVYTSHLYRKWHVSSVPMFCVIQRKWQISGENAESTCGSRSIKHLQRLKQTLVEAEHKVVND